MNKSDMFGFSLETDDRTPEERLSQNLAQHSPTAPMDTDYQETMEKHKPKIRFNLNFDK